MTMIQPTMMQSQPHQNSLWPMLAQLAASYFGGPAAGAAAGGIFGGGQHGFNPYATPVQTTGGQGGSGISPGAPQQPPADPNQQMSYAPQPAPQNSFFQQPPPAPPQGGGGGSMTGGGTGQGGGGSNPMQQQKPQPMHQQWGLPDKLDTGTIFGVAQALAKIYPGLFNGGGGGAA